MKINGTPQPGRYRWLGGRKRNPRRGCGKPVAALIVALLVLLVAAMTTG